MGVGYMAGAGNGIEIRRKLHIINIAVQDIVFPRSCPVCGQVTENGVDICPACEKELRPIGEPVCFRCGQPLAGAGDMWCPKCAGNHARYFSRARSLYRYNGAMRQSIYRLKYKNAKEYAIYYGKQMAAYVEGGAGGQYGTAETYVTAGKYGTAETYVTAGKYGTAGQSGAAVQYDAVVPVPMYRKKQKKRGYNQAELLAREIALNLRLPLRADLLVRTRETAPMKELSPNERKKNVRDAFRMRDARRPAPKSVLLVDDIYTTGATADACSYALKAGGVHRVDCLCLAMEDMSV